MSAAVDATGGYRSDGLTPPPGPGVTPPFAAPPTDGVRRRRRIGLSIGAAALVVCGIGGVVGIAALVVTGTDAERTAATRTVTGYLTAWRKGDFAGAYKLVCDDAKAGLTLPDFTAQLGGDALASFRLGQVELASSAIHVPATLTFADARVRTVRYAIGNTSRTDPASCVER